MSRASYKPRRLFTVEEANAMLPLVKAIASDLVSLSIHVIERRNRLDSLAPPSENPREGDPYAEESAEIEHELDRDTEQLREYARELFDLGVEPKNGPEGLVDFPCLMDGRVVYLCWKLGEAEISHWHEIEGGFAGRQPLPSGSLAELKPEA